MKKNIMTEWVSELRSGKYKQGYGLLKQIDDEEVILKHCCLGVLCELYQSEMKNNKKKQLDEAEGHHPDHLLDLHGMIVRHHRQFVGGQLVAPPPASTL